MDVYNSWQRNTNEASTRFVVAAITALEFSKPDASGRPGLPEGDLNRLRSAIDRIRNGELRLSHPITVIEFLEQTTP
ncbi:MAG: hypothetical protein AAB408_04370 [Patescibacteria group bacterium]